MDEILFLFFLVLFNEYKLFGLSWWEDFFLLNNVRVVSDIEKKIGSFYFISIVYREFGCCVI